MRGPGLHIRDSGVTGTLSNCPAGILPRGKIPRRHPYSSRVYKVKGSKVLTVKIYSIYTRSNLNLSGRINDLTEHTQNKWVMMTFHH